MARVMGALWQSQPRNHLDKLASSPKMLARVRQRSQNLESCTVAKMWLATAPSLMAKSLGVAVGPMASLMASSISPRARVTASTVFHRHAAKRGHARRRALQHLARWSSGRPSLCRSICCSLARWLAECKNWQRTLASFSHVAHQSKQLAVSLATQSRACCGPGISMARGNRWPVASAVAGWPARLAWYAGTRSGQDPMPYSVPRSLRQARTPLVAWYKSPTPGPP